MTKNLISNSKRAFFLAFLAAILWSTVATAFKIALRELSPFKLLLISSLVSSIALFIISIKNSKNFYFPFLSIFKFAKKNFVAGLLNPFLYYYFLFSAYSLLPAQEALALNYIWPIVLTILSAILLKQKITIAGYVGLLISFSGALFVILKGNFQEFKISNPDGAIFAICSSFFWSLFWILNLKDKRVIYEKLCGAFFFGSVLSFVYVLCFEDFSLNFFSISFAASIYVGLFEMGITFLIWLKALSLSNQNSLVASVAYLSPFLSLFFISFALSEQIRLYSVIGLVLILSGILIQKYYSKSN